MKPNQLLCGALCAMIALCAPFVHAAEEEGFDIESATPVTIDDPVDPQPGMVLNAYHEWTDNLSSQPATKTVLDKGDSFNRVQGTNAKVMRWEGFLKSNRAAVYTFTFVKSGDVRDPYSVTINGKPALGKVGGEKAFDAALQAGWNKVEIVCSFGNSDGPLTFSYRPKGSLAEPRPLGPKNLYYDKPVDDGFGD